MDPASVPAYQQMAKADQASTRKWTPLMILATVGAIGAALYWLKKNKHF